MIYGSSRLGTKDYLPGQLYSLVDYQQAQPVTDTSILNGRRPWYSGGFNDDIEPGATTVWGNTQTGPFLVSERIGEKQYELSNHLGNVQATVSDNRYEVADKSTDSILAYHPALRSAYDYYPFGMLMPGRYVSDTSQHCVTVTRPTWVWKEVTVACWDVYAWEWPSLELVGEATARVDGDAVEINAPNASDAVGYTFPVTPNVQQTLTLDIERINLNDKAYVEVLEQQGEEWVTLAERPIEVSSGGLEIPFKPKGNYIKVVWHGRILVWVRKDCISKLEWVEEDQLVTICDGDKDKYRFGYQKQEKDNEIAGIGNHYDFKFRGYDPRIGRFWGADPLHSKYPWNSDYAFAENDVIRAIDLEGAEKLIVTTPVLFGQDQTEVRTQQASDIQRYTAEAGVFMAHPVAASKVGDVERGGTNISSVVGRIARHVAERGNMSVDIGSERNSYRHVLWQATITNKFGSNIAHKIGNAHEGIKLLQSGKVDFNMPLVQDKYGLAADEVVDFLNNQIGRNVAKKLGENTSQIDIAKAVLKAQKDDGFWIVNKAKDGTYSIGKHKISEEQYNNALNTLNTLDQNGFNEADKQDLKKDKK